MIDANQLTPGDFYEVKFAPRMRTTGNTYLVEATTNSQVQVYFCNGSKDDTAGTIGGFSSIRKITREYAQTGQEKPMTNKAAAAAFLEKD